MASVTFKFVEADGRFQIYDSDGKEVVVEAGKNFTTDDPNLIRELDAAPHAVKRVGAKDKDKEA